MHNNGKLNRILVNKYQIRQIKFITAILGCSTNAKWDLGTGINDTAQDISNSKTDPENFSKNSEGTMN